MKSDLFSVLSRDLNELLSEHEEQNVIIQIGNEVNYKEFYAHSIILRARCKYFKSGLSCDWVKREGNRIIFKKPNITPEVFEVILKYIYSATIAFEKYDVMHLLDVLVAADELLLSEMAESIQEYLLNHKAEWLQKDFTKLLRKSQEFDWCGKVQECCQAIVCNDPLCLFESSEFLTLEENLVISFLKLDNLIMKEIEIWNYLLKWGKSQIPPKEDGSPAIDDDESKWTKDDIHILGKALKGCIPHIRWFHIEPNLLFNKIWPLKDIFPPELLGEIFRYYFTSKSNLTSIDSSFIYYKPQRPLPFESSILQQLHVAKLANWIDRKDGRNDTPYTYYNIPYNLKLLGDTPCTWDNLNEFKISRPRRSEYAIRIKDRTCGPCFGDKDLWMTSNFNEDENCSAVKDDYELEITPTEKFSVDEYEVFQVLNKIIIKDVVSNENNNDNNDEEQAGNLAGGDNSTANEVNVENVEDVTDTTHIFRTFLN
ncbi:12107_t:CDS:2 [Funneliformis caledonium]|uniref:12107_t:CDS:1 n=1 Tax=Funneliformis caledonium TaxID=1117310 RepID=A0A9N8YY16_9GLOM|nr:12107_t:CDS:2 [Funneliformis caledonium]